MKKSLNFLLLLLMVAMVFTSCKKDDPAPTPAQLIIGKWKEVGAVGCDADDVTEFTAGGAFIITAGTNKCNPSDPASTTASYTLSADGKTLNITDSGFTLPFTIVELTASSLKISFAGTTISFTKI